jgi:hypothetical protein
VHQDAKALVTRLRERDDKQFKDPELARSTHSSIGKLHYKGTVRHEIFEYLKNVALLPRPVPGRRDTAESAIVSARIRELAVASRTTRPGNEAIPLGAVEVPKYSKNAIRALTPVQRCPEVYLDDEELQAAIKMGKMEFHALSELKQSELRAMLMVCWQ